jgi:N-acetylmuramoyl-L-alanine amidase
MPGVAVLLALATATAPSPGALTVASSRGVREVAIRSERGFPAVAAPDLAAVLSLSVDSVDRAGGGGGGTAWLHAAGRRFAFVFDDTYFRFGERVLALAAPPYLDRDTLFLPLQWVVEYLPRLIPSRYRYDPVRVRLDELPAATDSTVALAARPADTGAVPAPPVPVASPSPGAPAAPAAPLSAAARASGLRMAHVVAIDAGHGGPDVGMVGPAVGRKFLREKDVTLATARDVAAELRRRGVGVVMTRTTDTLISLEDRGRLARAGHADLFVSIHVNAANPHWRDAAGARGIETYFLAEARTEDAQRVARMENESMRFEKNPDASDGPMQFILNDLLQNEHLRESSRLAVIMERSLGRAQPGEARGVKQAGFAVLATSYMPAVLVEIGFGSNPAEARILTSDAGQRRLARAIADAVVSYLVEYEHRLPADAAGGEGGGTR